jgi:hypothetical protein
MSILNGQAVVALFNARSPVVDDKGVPTVSIGRSLLQALYNRSGGQDGIVPTVSKPLTAAGTTSADALGLKDDWNNVTTTGSGSGVIISPLLDLQPGNDIWVFNGGANNLNVYPPSASVVIDAQGAGTPFVLGNGKLRCFQCWTSTQYHTYGN